MPTDERLCPVHGDAALDPDRPSGASASCPACALLAARLGDLQVLARALPMFVPPAVDRDVMRARIVAASPAVPAPTTAPRTARMTRVRWGLGLGLLAGAAVAVIAFVARPRHELPRVAGEPSVPATKANAATSNPSEMAPVPAVAPTPTTTPVPAVATRKKAVPPPARRNGAVAEERSGGRHAPTLKTADGPTPPAPLAGAVATEAPSPAPASNQPVAPAPAAMAGAARPPKLARDERAATGPGPAVNGGGQNNAGPAAAATSSVRSAIVSAPASNPTAPAASQAADRTTDPGARDDRAQERAQRRQEMRERRREERIRRVERRR